MFLCLMLCCRLINPVVVAPTVAAIGLAFFSYGFPQAGSCVEISIPQILLVLIFALVSYFHRILSNLYVEFLYQAISQILLFIHFRDIMKFCIFNFCFQYLRGISVFGHHLFRIYAVCTLSWYTWILFNI